VYFIKQPTEKQKDSSEQYRETQKENDQTIDNITQQKGWSYLE
jgi:hypothetical protein